MGLVRIIVINLNTQEITHYDSNIVPRIGETVTWENGEGIVQNVIHQIKPRIFIQSQNELATVLVQLQEIQEYEAVNNE